MLYHKILALQNSPIIFWGASLFLGEFLNEYNLEDSNVLGVVDTDIEKQGKFFNQYKIISPNELEIFNNITILVTVKNKANIVFEEVSKYISELKNQINLLPNIFSDFINDKKVESIATNKLFLVNSNGERKAVSYLQGLDVEWLGDNSVIEIGGNPIPKFTNTTIICKDNCKISIDSSIHYIKNLYIKSYANNFSLQVGENFSCEGVTIFANEPNLSINIGANCMFSHSVYLRPCDAHTIFDKNSNIINRGKDIVVGNKVWIGQGVTLLKNAKVSDNTVVGLGSIVTKKFNESSVIIAGNPAKILKRGITWSREHIND